MNKKIFSLIALVTVFASAVAQKNTLLIAGNLDILSTKLTQSFPSPGGTQPNTSTSKGSGFNFSPTIGYQFSDAWTVGVLSSILNGKTESSSFPTSNTSLQKINAFAVGPMVRYTKKISDIFSIFGQLESKFGKNKSTISYSTSPSQNYSEKNTTAEINLFPAVFINLKNSFGLNFNLGGMSYTSNKSKDADVKINDLNFNFGKLVNIGISKNFGMGNSKARK